jgi:hypothetical protein
MRIPASVAYSIATGRGRGFNSRPSLQSSALGRARGIVDC